MKIGEGEALAVTEKCELKLTGDGWTISAWWSTDSIKAEEEHVLASSRKGNFHCYFKRGRPCAGKKSVDFDATSRVDTTKPWHHIVAVVSAPKKRPRADSKAGRAAREEAMRATASGGVPPADPELGSTTFYIDGELVGSVKQAVVEPIALIGNDVTSSRLDLPPLLAQPCPSPCFAEPRMSPSAPGARRLAHWLSCGYACLHARAE